MRDDGNGDDDEDVSGDGGGGAERWWLPTFIEALLCAKYKIHIAL